MLFVPVALCLSSLLWDTGQSARPRAGPGKDRRTDSRTGQRVVYRHFGMKHVILYFNCIESKYAHAL